MLISVSDLVFIGTKKQGVHISHLIKNLQLIVENTRVSVRSEPYDSANPTTVENRCMRVVTENWTIDQGKINGFLNLEKRVRHLSGNQNPTNLSLPVSDTKYELWFNAEIDIWVRVLFSEISTTGIFNRFFKYFHCYIFHTQLCLAHFCEDLPLKSGEI